MFEACNERLAELMLQRRQKEHAADRLQRLASELPKAERKRDRLRRAWLAERRDVERLRGLSFGALFLALLGKRRERLSKEEEEMLKAKLALEEAEDTVNDLRAERGELEQLMRQLDGVEAKVAAALAEKEALIRARHPDLAGTLDDLTDQEAREGAAAKELEEALSAGRNVLRAMERAEEHLRSAKNWGIYDMLGGGFLSTAIKHNRIDDARSALHAAQAGLKRFRAELADVARDVQLELELGTFLSVGDYLFDGLLFDWVVQGRINEALDKTRQQTSRVRRVMGDLERALRQTRHRMDLLRRRRETVIREA